VAGRVLTVIVLIISFLRKVEPMKKRENNSSNKHTATAAKAATFLGKIHTRAKPIDFEIESEPDDDDDKEETDDASTLSYSSLHNYSSTGVRKYVSTTNSKTMTKSYRLFDVTSFDAASASHTTGETLSSSQQSNHRNSEDTSSQQRVVFPLISPDPKKEQTKSLFIQTSLSFAASDETLTGTSTANTAVENKPKSSSKSKEQTTPSSHLTNRKSRERKMTRRQNNTAPSPSHPRTSSHISLSSGSLKKLKSSASSSSLPSLPPEQLSKYFGNQSKLIFFDTYRELHHLRDQVLGGNHEIDHYITLEQKDLDQEIDEISASQGKEWSNRSYHDESSTIMTQEEDDGDMLSLGGSDTYSPFSPHKSTNLQFDEGSLSTVGSGTVVSSLSKRSFTPSSPRAKYLAGCIKNNVAPRSSLLLRDTMSSSLMLEHQGIGDTMGELLSTGLLDIPHITSVNIADNNLTDASLTLIINTIAQRPSITELNISRNKVGSKTAKALGDYLRLPSCTLKKLSMRASNVDDTECHQFVDALGYNRCLEVRLTVFERVREVVSFLRLTFEGVGSL
jgi:hypothetical protein